LEWRRGDHRFTGIGLDDDDPRDDDGSAHELKRLQAVVRRAARTVG